MTTAMAEMYSVRVRRRGTGRDMSGRLRAPDPFAGTVFEPLVLPDGHGRLQLVDQHPAGLEGVPAMGARHRHHHGQVTDGQVTDPVYRGHPERGELLRDLPGHPAQLGLGGRMGLVAEAGDRLAVVVVPHGPGEQRDPARPVVGYGLVDL